MPVVVLFIIFVVLLVIAVPVSITLGITSVLPSVFDPSFTVGAKYLIRAMFGGLDSFPLLAVPMFVLSGIIMAKGGISKKLFDVFAYFLGKFTAGMLPLASVILSIISIFFTYIASTLLILYSIYHLPFDFFLLQVI